MESKQEHDEIDHEEKLLTAGEIHTVGDVAPEPLAPKTDTSVNLDPTAPSGSTADPDPITTTNTTTLEPTWTAPSASIPPAQVVEQPPRFNFNKYFLYTLVGGLIICALISVVAVLVGSFNETMTRALATTGVMVIHTLVALFLVSNTKSKGVRGNLLIDTLLLITVASFITSILAIWQIIDGRITSDLYILYFYTFCASLWIQLLQMVGANLLDKATHLVSQISIGFTVIFYLLLIPTVFTNYPDKLPEFYYRVIAAALIVLATSSVLNTVFHRIYVFKHPAVKLAQSLNAGWDIIIAVIVVFVGLPAIFGFVSLINSYSTVSAYDYNYRSSSSTESPSPGTDVLYDGSQSDATPTPSTETESTYINCQSLPGFQNPRVLMYSGAYIFRSNNDSQKAINTVWADGTTMQPISYADKGVLSVVDTNCKTIPASSLQSGDRIRVYLKVGYKDFYEDALQFVQKQD